MSEDSVDYGPLAGLVGTWRGDKGTDLSPEPDGEEEAPYFETLTFETAGDVTNAEEQVLAALRYHQVVSRKATGEVFHDEVGYWMWDKSAGQVMHSLAIPRAVTLVAGGAHTGMSEADGGVVFEVEAGSDDWPIAQSPFMRDKARTLEFRHRIELTGDRLFYAETTVVEIYGRTMDHTDTNMLTREQ